MGLVGPEAVRIEADPGGEPAVARRDRRREQQAARRPGQRPDLPDDIGPALGRARGLVDQLQERQLPLIHGGALPLAGPSSRRRAAPRGGAVMPETLDLGDAAVHALKPSAMAGAEASASWVIYDFLKFLS